MLNIYKHNSLPEMELISSYKRLYIMISNCQIINYLPLSNILFLNFLKQQNIFANLAKFIGFKIINNIRVLTS